MSLTTGVIYLQNRITNVCERMVYVQMLYVLHYLKVSRISLIRENGIVISLHSLAISVVTSCIGCLYVK